ncbi:MAG: hypothetical protein KF803_03470 [Cyclobacteriaceae bacterium]|nr:hypothetical protein [Cyclobacteriaceae bacterium]
MTPSLLNRVTFPWLPWALLLLIPITFFGFYPTYFSRLTGSLPTVYHLHSGMMLLWLFMAITQPFLIKYNKIWHHKTIGKASYMLLSLIIASGYFILRFSYHRVLAGEVVGPPGYYPDDLPLHIKAAEFVVIGSVYWVWLMVYYALGVYFRKRLVAHATFMTAAALTILGPAGDRLIGHICDAMHWPFNAVAGNFVFGLVAAVFLGLLIMHKKKNLEVQPTITVLAIHGLGVFLFYTMPFHPVWSRVAAFLFS